MSCHSHTFKSWRAWTNMSNRWLLHPLKLDSVDFSVMNEDSNISNHCMYPCPTDYLCPYITCSFSSTRVSCKSWLDVFNCFWDWDQGCTDASLKLFFWKQWIHFQPPHFELRWSSWQQQSVRVLPKPTWTWRGGKLGKNRKQTKLRWKMPGDSKFFEGWELVAQNLWYFVWSVWESLKVRRWEFSSQAKWWFQNGFNNNSTIVVWKTHHEWIPSNYALKGNFQ